ADPVEQPTRGADALADAVAAKSGLAGPTRAYTTACVAPSTAGAGAAARIALGRTDRVGVAAGYLVEPDQFALFDAGRALATHGSVGPFSFGRTGLLLGGGAGPRPRGQFAPIHFWPGRPAARRRGRRGRGGVGPGGPGPQRPRAGA